MSCLVLSMAPPPQHGNLEPVLCDVRWVGSSEFSAVAMLVAAFQAIDHTTQVLSLKYNRGQPVIFNTYQAYLKDSHTRLLEDMERARREGYVFAAKLVRRGPKHEALHALHLHVSNSRLLAVFGNLRWQAAS